MKWIYISTCLISMALVSFAYNPLPPLWCREPPADAEMAVEASATESPLVFPTASERRTGQDTELAVQNGTNPHGAGRKHFCFEHLCCCSSISANCSGTKGRLKFIPKLNDSIVTLYFENNSLTAINVSDFFSNITQIVTLSLAFNSLVYIHPAAFKPLKNLRHLILEKNNFTLKSLKPAFSIQALGILDIRGNKLLTPNPQYFQSFNASKIYALYLQQNRWETLDFAALQPLRYLSLLGLSGNNILHIWPGFLCLRKLDLMDNVLTEFPYTCRSNVRQTCGHKIAMHSNSLLPNLKILLLKGNRISALPRMICLPRLKLLDLGNNKFAVLYKHMFNVALFPVLQELFLENMDRPISSIEERAFSVPSLLRISLMFNAIDFYKSVHNDAFLDCPFLHSLQLSHNIFIDMTDDKFQNLFGNLTIMHNLYLLDCQIKTISQATFVNLNKLENLNLGKNKISSLPDGVFDHLPLLNTIDLNSNDLTVVPEKAFGETLRSRLKHLDISGNPFVCSCDLLWFRQWLLTNRSLFMKGSRGPYRCGNRPFENVTTFEYSEQACLLSHDAYVFTVVSVGVLLFTLMLAASLFRYRWHLRLILYEVFRGPATRRRLHLQANHFMYDLFVSYSAEDLDWVRAHLLPELEGRLGLKLCIHQRDFLIGQNIVDNITRGVETSKKVMLIFSTNFARSHWCQFELALCLRHVMEQDDQLVVVCLHEMPSRDMTSIMLAVLKTTTYIEWCEEPDARASFWGRMMIALNEIIP